MDFTTTATVREIRIVSHACAPFVHFYFYFCFYLFSSWSSWTRRHRFEANKKECARALVITSYLTKHTPLHTPCTGPGTWTRVSCMIGSPSFLKGKILKKFTSKPHSQLAATHERTNDAATHEARKHEQKREILHLVPCPLVYTRVCNTSGRRSCRLENSWPEKKKKHHWNLCAACTYSYRPCALVRYDSCRRKNSAFPPPPSTPPPASRLPAPSSQKESSQATKYHNCCCTARRTTSIYCIPISLRW